jgi:hypothetical protein
MNLRRWITSSVAMESGFFFSLKSPWVFDDEEAFDDEEV